MTLFQYKRFCIVEWLKLGGKDQEEVVMAYYTTVCMEGLRKNRHSLGLDSNLLSLKHKAGVVNKWDIKFHYKEKRIKYKEKIRKPN